MAWFTAMLYLGKALSPPLMGAVYRLSGNYEKSYIVLILTAAASFVLLIIAMNIAPMKKLRREAEQSAAADAVKG
jgi:cyanate permease